MLETSVRPLSTCVTACSLSTLMSFATVALRERTSPATAAKSRTSTPARSVNCRVEGQNAGLEREGSNLRRDVTDLRRAHDSLLQGVSHALNVTNNSKILIARSLSKKFASCQSRRHRINGRSVDPAVR